jgi:hypothetical protein
VASGRRGVLLEREIKTQRNTFLHCHEPTLAYTCCHLPCPQLMCWHQNNCESISNKFRPSVELELDYVCTQIESLLTQGLRGTTFIYIFWPMAFFRPYFDDVNLIVEISVSLVTFTSIYMGCTVMSWETKVST